MKLIENGIFFVETLEICGKIINVYMDDYGQCFFFTWEEDGEVHEESCGTYNTDYKDYIKMKFDDEYRNAWLRSIGIEPRIKK